jgi:hypothetical protein
MHHGAVKPGSQGTRERASQSKGMEGLKFNLSVPLTLAHYNLEVSEWEHRGYFDLF